MGAAPVDHPLRPARRYVLPVHLRHKLADPFGPIVQTEGLAEALAGCDPIVAVGDVVSITLHELGIDPAVFVCDYKTQRGAPSTTYEEVLSSWGQHEHRVQNPPGEVTAAAWDAMEAGLQETGISRIVVEGEEDLFGLPALALLPEGGAMVYGMPGQGVVVARATPALKQQVVHLLQGMVRL